MNKIDIKSLKSCPLFSGFEEDEITSVLERAGAYREAFSSGDRVPLESRGKSRMGILLTGGLKVTSLSDGTILNRPEPGSLFGVACLYGEVCADTHIFATRTSSILFLDGDASETLWENALLRKNLISFLTDRIRFLNRKIASFTAQGSEEKLLCWLRQNADENGIVVLTRSYAELARVLHLGRASLYRGMEKLMARGALVKDGKNLKLLETEKTVII